MDNTILTKIIKKEQLTDDDVERILHDICEDVHSGCDFSCPIYKDVLTTEQINSHSCSFLKNGKAMRKTLELWYTKLDPIIDMENNKMVPKDKV